MIYASYLSSLWSWRLLPAYPPKTSVGMRNSVRFAQCASIGHVSRLQLSRRLTSHLNAWPSSSQHVVRCLSRQLYSLIPWKWCSRDYWCALSVFYLHECGLSSTIICRGVALQSARYLTFDRRITECWSQLGAAVCTAQALGLHRDPAGMV